MTRSSNSVAVAADYADAMMTARRAKNWLFVLLLLMLLTQLALFFLVRYVKDFRVNVEVTPKTGVAVPTTQFNLTVPTTAPSTAGGLPAPRSYFWTDFLQYVVGVIDFLGIAFVIILAIVLLLIVLIMLVGRLIGVTHVTSAFIWCIVLAVLLFPWQAFLDPAVFKIPGILYTWSELQAPWGGRMEQQILGWGRFVGFPVLALLILLTIQAKSSRGLKFALGESDVQLDATNSRSAI